MSLYASLASILDYPGAGLAGALAEGIAALRPARPEAARQLQRFQADSERLGQARLEELYANTFDLQADCSLYAGYHLFGDDWRRSLFLTELQRRYAACGFSCGHEAPDHLVALLRFLAVQTDSAEEAALRADCLVPTAAKIAGRLDPARNPYRAVFEALLLCLDAPAVGAESNPVRSDPKARFSEPGDQGKSAVRSRQRGPDAAQRLPACCAAPGDAPDIGSSDFLRTKSAGLRISPRRIP